MGDAVEIPVKLKEIDQAQKQVEGLRASARGFFEDMQKGGEAAGKAIREAVSAAGSALTTAGAAGATAFGQSGGGFQQGATAFAKAGVAQIPGILAAAGAAAGPGGAAAGLIGGSLIAGGLERQIDAGAFEAVGVEGVARRNARGRVAQAAGAAGQFGIELSDEAIKRAIQFTEGFEQRGYLQSRRVLDMQVWN